MTYTIPYEVPAETRLDAIVKVSALLRTGVTVRNVIRVGPTIPGWYEVVVEVDEPDAIDQAKAYADWTENHV